MPYRRVYRRKKTPVFRRKKAYRRSYGKISRYTGISSSRRFFNLFPDRYRFKMRYAVSYAATGAVDTTATFRGNSIYDPEYAVGGGQPAGFDQLAGIYNKYVITGCKLFVKILPYGESVGQATQIVCTIRPVNGGTPSATGYTGVTDYAVSKYGDASIQPFSVSKYISTRKITGRKTTEADLTGAINGNPSHEWYWEIRCSTADQTTNISVHTLVYLVYYGYFVERTQNADV